MSYLKRIEDVLNKDTNAVLKYQSNILRKIGLNRNIFKFQFATEEIETEKISALENPIKFIYSYLNEEVIENAIKKNPEITRILKDNNLPINYDLENVSSIIASHLIPTARIAQKMYLNINKNHTDDNYNSLIQASLLHDIGKIFIPKEILNKKSALSMRERSIIELHNRLSYEILKTTDLPKKVAYLCWEHHNYDNSFKRTLENQVLMIADIYCALREKRPYKKAINDICAKTILYDMGTKGQFDAGFIKYLCC